LTGPSGADLTSFGGAGKAARSSKTNAMIKPLSVTDHPSVIRDRTLLWNYALILVNTGIRVGEARTLCWKDIRIEPSSS
jgi:integrase